MKCLHYWYIILFLSFFSCKPTDEITPTDEILSLLEKPTHFPVMPQPSYNPMTRDGVYLGRMLFFETALSSNNQVSCQSCHHQELAFADGLALTNKGVSGKDLHRNSPALMNLAWATNGMFWDGGALNIESLIIGPITHLDEMGLNVLDIPEKLSGKNNYPALFDKAFPDDKTKGVTPQKVLKAIAQYIRTLNSADTKYDKYVLNNNTLTSAEQQGMKVFDTKCASCHDRSGHLFTDNSFHNNGLDNSFLNEDFERAAQGRFRITFKNEDLGKFKTPTLRNLAYTAPFMHDGRFKTLEDVLNHYASGIKQSPSLDGQLRNFTLSKDEKQQLLVFLNTLNDENFVKNKSLRP